MKSSDEDSCPAAPPPRSCLRSGPIRSRRVTFSQESGGLCEDEEGPGGGRTVFASPLRPLLTSNPGLNDVTLWSQEVRVPADHQRGLQLCLDGRGHTWSDTWSASLQSDGTPPRCVGVSELSLVLGGLLQLVEQHWNGPGSLQRHPEFLGGAYDLLSELLQPAGGRGHRGHRGHREEEGAGFRWTSQSSELVLLRRKLDRTEQQLETMKSRLLSTLKENYQLRRRRGSGEAAGTSADLRTAETHTDL